MADHLSELIGMNVTFAKDCIGEVPAENARALKSGEILLLENTRFHPEEKANDPAFAQELSTLADVYVNDAFSVSHRKHSSVYNITKYFPKKSIMGFLFEKEVSMLTTYLKNPKRPFFAVIGGAKISTKINLIIKW